LYNGHLNEILFQIIRNRLGPNPNNHPNTLQNRKEAFITFLIIVVNITLNWSIEMSTFAKGRPNS